MLQKVFGRSRAGYEWCCMCVLPHGITLGDEHDKILLKRRQYAS